MIQRPGIWPQVFVWKQARYDKIGGSFRYTQVQVFCGNEVIVDIPVQRPGDLDTDQSWVRIRSSSLPFQPEQETCVVRPESVAYQ